MILILLVAVSAGAQPEIKLQLISDEFSQCLYVTTPGDGSGRLFVVEQNGRIRIYQNGNVNQSDFLNVGPDGLNLTSASGERGLLGLAFHPSYETNGRFFISYTRRSDGASVVSEWSVSEDPDIADDTSEKIVFGPLSQPYPNHNGGHIAFGPDGYLYYSLGDGGSAGDPLGHGQDPTTFYGSILRIDVDNGDPYGIPPDNPFVGKEGLDEIFAYGLRNPWRFSFDESKGRIFCGDVGQADYEEVDLIENGGNYGWNIMEGFHCYPPSVSDCETSGLILPIYEYPHTDGISITGGYVYRGEDYPSLEGYYFFGDFGNGNIWVLEETSPDEWTPHFLLSSGKNITSFGRDENGELYVCGHGGFLYKITVPVVTEASGWFYY